MATYYGRCRSSSKFARCCISIACVLLNSAAPEPLTPLMPPVGLKAVVLSSTTIVLMWSDTTLGRSQRVIDNRFYTVRYSPRSVRKYRLVNTTDLNVHIEDLRADTEFEFSVKVTRGARQSTWSLSVSNKTRESGRVAYFSKQHDVQILYSANKKSSAMKIV